MASLMVPTTPVSRRALEATPSKKVSLEAVGIRELYLNLSQGCSRFSGHILGLADKAYSKISSH